MSRWAKLGAKPADIPYCNHFAARLKGLGWNAGEIDQAIGFGLKHAGEGWQKFEGLAIHEARKIGLDDHALDAALSVGDQVIDTPGIRDALEAQAFAEAHVAGPQKPADGRIAEIERIMRDDPHAYWKDERLQAEFARLIEAKETGTPSTPAPAGGRRAEIEALMARDAHEYWGNEAVQTEYAAIIEQETAE